jgi:hypothetical protein
LRSFSPSLLNPVPLSPIQPPPKNHNSSLNPPILSFYSSRFPPLLSFSLRVPNSLLIHSRSLGVEVFFFKKKYYLTMIIVPGRDFEVFFQLYIEFEFDFGDLR